MRSWSNPTTLSVLHTCSKTCQDLSLLGLCTGGKQWGTNWDIFTSKNIGVMKNWNKKQAALLSMLWFSSRKRLLTYLFVCVIVKRPVRFSSPGPRVGKLPARFHLLSATVLLQLQRKHQHTDGLAPERTSLAGSPGGTRPSNRRFWRNTWRVPSGSQPDTF